MALPNIFTEEIADKIIQRIHFLDSNTQANWGKMDVAQMLAHTNVMYEMVYENKHPEPNFFARWIMKTFVKRIVVSETPYKRNSKTAPAFIINGSRNFENEKKRLIYNIQKTQQLGESNFDNKVSHSFGALTTTEWNNMFYKHIDHHLTQFGN